MHETGLNFDARIQLTREVLKTLTHWEVSRTDQPLLLGLGPGLKRREFNRHLLGNPLPDQPAIYARVGSLLRIDAALDKLFPHSRLSADLWITTPRKKFQNQRPLDLMIQRGLPAMRLIERVLDNRQ